ncbi:MAG: histidine-type phosphatase [Aeromicrobium sp.]
MRIAVKLVTLLMALLVGLVGLVGPATAKTPAPVSDYANQAPYGNPKSSSIKSPPKGYSMFFLETLGRHGARSATSDSTEKRVLSVWQKASDKKQLTAVGQNFARDIRLFQGAERKVGYGKLSGLGKDEMAGIGRRTALNYKSFFTSVKKKKQKIATVTTDVTRTKQSADAEVASMTRTLPTLKLTSLLNKPVAADQLMHLSNDASSAGSKITKQTLALPSVKGYAKTVLTTIYTRKYVDGIKDPVGAALDIYSLYQTAPSMKKETNISFARYVPRATREPLSYATDVKTFFKYGPGVKGQTSSFSDAKPLLANFFKRLNARVKGNSTAAVLRFAHGETTMPFAALIKAPGSGTQVPKGQRFTRQLNPWRGAVAGKMSGNIEWAAYRKKKYVLVTMRYNEVPVKFNSSCKPYKKGSYFYRVSELRRCLN